MNKIHYVYMYVDPFTLYNNSVLGYNIQYLPYYIGKGVKNRYSDHFSEAMRYANKNIYKENKIRQIYNKLNKNRNEFLKYVIILDYFSTNEEAYNLEYKLIEYFGRKIKGDGILTNIDLYHKDTYKTTSRYDNMLLYDAKIKECIQIDNYIKWCIDNKINPSWMSCSAVTQLRYATIDNSNLADEVYKRMYATIYKIYKKHHTLYLNGIQMLKLLGNDWHYLINNENNYKSIKGYYADYNSNITFYKKYNVYKASEVITGTSRYLSNTIGPNILKVIGNNPTRHHTNGWFIDKNKNDEYYSKRNN